MFNTDGLINTVITFFGGPKINWMAGANSALFVIVLLRVWQFGSAMVIFLAALKGVSEDLYEAASIDGAGKWTQFFKITVPLITPVIFYNLITQLCQAFQEFNAPFLVTKGGPNGATTLISMLIYNNAFLRHKMGMASAQAWILFLIVMTLTAVAFISQKKMGLLFRRGREVGTYDKRDKTESQHGNPLHPADSGGIYHGIPSYLDGWGHI